MTLNGRYTATAILLHWLIAILILANLALPTIWENLAPDNAVRPLVNLHKSIGISVLGLLAMRILWRVTHRPPELPEGYKPWEKLLAMLVHIALYLGMIGVPLVGYLMDSAWKRAAENPLMLFGVVEIPRFGSIMALDDAKKEAVHHFFEEAHELGGYLLAALIVLHVLGALKHQLIDRESELERMWFAKGRPK